MYEIACFRGSGTRTLYSNNLIRTMHPAPTAMNADRHLVVVKAPVDRVYEHWSRLEDLPKFVTPLQDVCRIDETHFSYTWLPNGSEEKGIFHIVVQIPGRRIAWRTMSNGFMSGGVSFDPHSLEDTGVTLR